MRDEIANTAVEYHRRERMNQMNVGTSVTIDTAKPPISNP